MYLDPNQANALLRGMAGALLSSTLGWAEDAEIVAWGQ